MADKNTKYMFADTCEPLFYMLDRDSDTVSWVFIMDSNEAVSLSDSDMDDLIQKGKVVQETEEALSSFFTDAINGKGGENAINMFGFLELPAPTTSDKKEENTEDEGEVIKVPDTYRPELCNTSISPEVLVKKLKIAESKTERPDCISILFEGVPGSGKTLAAAYIGKELGKTVKSYRLSELQNKYVGESEKLIAEAFDKAEENGHILHIDEIDSLSRSRNDESKGHEIKMCNTLLQCLDRFKGIFIATTNYRDELDSAVKRRFLLKQEFKNCTSEQANELSKLFFGKRIAPMNLPNETFAPADFNIVKNSFLFEEDKTINRKFILKRLTEEAKDRNGKDLVNKKKVGFL